MVFYRLDTLGPKIPNLYHRSPYGAQPGGPTVTFASLPTGDPNEARDHNGCTALMFAVANGNEARGSTREKWPVVWGSFLDRTRSK